ncbi:uncharacterized protein F13E9.13, mitochondrial isoform X1 [Photinus pyralis]|uniref:BtpA family membrane complex biogenesis protein n=1 Tax=Photinus pyralis TaxID=7054 RepID=A0A1Y1LF66_PHOPY|nr:uncharacterized protein F13E9.13, mitochondrial isoform X1 [Photinus pyralis]
MFKFKQLFPNKCSVIAMVHAGAFPGTPLYRGSVQSIVDKACMEAETYIKHQVDGIIVENMNDLPYIQSKHFGPETVATMTKICERILAGGNREALAVAKVCNFNFIRTEGFVFGHIADEGMMDADAGLLLRYRKGIDAESVSIFTDIKKKHSSHAITSDLSLVETAHAAEFFCSDGIILTGIATGSPASTEELLDLKTHCNLPVIIGSGVTDCNVANYSRADALIVGSYFKDNGNWMENVSPERVGRLMKVVNVFRTANRL